MPTPEGFAEKVAGYSDAQVAEALASAADYTPDSLAVIAAEWDKRKLTAAKVAPILAKAKERADTAAKRKPTATIAHKGIGLICYGKDYSSGQGYITTQWFCGFWIPLFPTASFHVEEIAFGAEGVTTSIKINLRQVGRTYLFLIFAGLFAYGAAQLYFEISDRGQEALAFGFAMLAVIAPIFCLQLWRRNVRRKRTKPSLDPARPN